MKRLKITPVKHAQSGRWQVRIPAKLSGTGKRETKYFPTKAEAIGYISNLEDIAAGLHLGETLMTRSEYDAIIEELARLAPFDVTLKDVIDYYIARHRASDARKISILEPLYRDTLQDASSHYRSRVRQVLGAFASVFGDCLIDDITQDEFEKWLAGWKTTPPSYNSALRHIKPFLPGPSAKNMLFNPLLKESDNASTRGRLFPFLRPRRHIPCWTPVGIIPETKRCRKIYA